MYSHTGLVNRHLVRCGGPQVLLQYRQ